MYYFGGNEVETTLMEYGWHNNTQPRANTGFYLNRIEHPINGLILFEYHSANYKVGVSAMHSVQQYLETLASGGYPIQDLIEKKNCHWQLSWWLVSSSNCI